MSDQKALIKKLSEDQALRQSIIDTPTREGKQQIVRDAGLSVPDHHDVLLEVAGGSSDTELDGGDVAAGAIVGAAAAA